MTVKEFIETYKPRELTFIKAVARKDTYSPAYHSEYQTTSILYPSEVSSLLEYIVLNDAQPPIDWLSGSPWIKRFEAGEMDSLLVISPEDFKLLYTGEDQRNNMIDYIDKQIRDRRRKISLKEYREKSILSQRELAVKAGINLRTLQDYEQGRKPINQAAAITVVKLAHALQCKITDLIEPEEDNK